MKITMISKALTLTTFASFLVACPAKKPETDTAKASYFLGQQIGQNLRKQNLQLDRGLIMQGLSDALGNKESLLSKEEIQAAQQILSRMASEQMAEIQKVSLKTATEFLEANKKNPGWLTTASGLQYKVLKEGKGRKPKATDTVSVHYVGTLHDGTKFDSSRDRGTPAEFKMNAMIKGMAEALLLMPEGSHWVILLPSSLAYGPSGSGPIPPNAVLMFDVELLKIK